MKNTIHNLKNSNINPFSKNKPISRYFVDPLTNMPNIYQLRSDLEDVDVFSLIVFNIDNIGVIRNFYGYIVSDVVMEEIAKELDAYLKAHTIYRLSDNEFAFVVYKEMFFYDLKKLLVMIYDNLQDTVIEYKEYKIYIDFTLASSASSTNTNVFSKVSMALKYAKDSMSPFWIYEDSMNFEENYAYKLKMSTKIREALNMSRIIPYFQAIADVKTSKIVKYECLARLIDAKGDIISPFIFIPIAKKIKHYGSVTRAIIDKSFLHFELLNCEFTINLAFEDMIKKEMFTFIMNKLENSKIAHKVTFEILESDAIEDCTKVNHFITEIRRYGAKIAIDDFGSGYSNFSYLTSLQVDYIKIDGSLIKDIDTDENAIIVVETIVQFAQKLGIKTVAEYVHSNSVFEKVKEMGIDYAQGYYFDEPSEETRECKK